MNYRNLYSKIIEKRIECKPFGYTEKHHIVPKCLGGDESDKNLVELTAREHFICHYLLAKMYQEGTYEWYKMNHAFARMKSITNLQNRYFNSRLYDALAPNRSKVMSKLQKGKSNSQYGSKWIHNPTEKISRKICNEEEVPEGWYLGRVVNWDLIEKGEQEKKQKDLNKKIAWLKERVEAIKLYKQFLDSECNSLRTFCKAGYYEKSHVSLHKLWKRHNIG